MAGAKLISTRLTVCAACGHEARLVASTSEEVVSRCYACGDVTRTPHTIPPAWSAAAGIHEQREQLRTGIAAAEAPPLSERTRVAAG